MGQIDLAFKTQNIDPRDHLLSVLIEADSFVYGIFDKSHNLIAAGNHIIDTQSDHPLSRIQEDNNIRSDYYKTLITYSTTEFAHLGELDYASGEFEIYFNNLTSGDEVLSDRFTDSNVHVVYTVNKNLRLEINKLVKPTDELHISTTMRQYIYPSQSNKNIVLVESDRFHYMSYKAGELTMYNAYTYRTKEDFLYFLQLATDFSHVDRNVDVLEVGGWLGSDSDIYKSISPYFRHIKWVTLPFMNLKSTNENHLKHHYFALYAAVLCVS